MKPNPFGVRRIPAPAGRAGGVLVTHFERLAGHLSGDEALALAVRLIRAADPRGRRCRVLLRGVGAKEKGRT